MAAYTRIFLGIVLCATSVYSLKCFTCDLELNNANCLTATNCSSNATSCQTELISVKAGSVALTTITKTCAESCSASSTSYGPSTFTTSCCGTDLCNTSGGAIITSSYTAIILALGSVLTILRSAVM